MKASQAADAVADCLALEADCLHRVAGSLCPGCQTGREDIGIALRPQACGNDKNFAHDMLRSLLSRQLR